MIAMKHVPRQRHDWPVFCFLFELMRAGLSTRATSPAAEAPFEAVLHLAYRR